MSDLIFSFNVVLPLLLVAACGHLSVRSNIVDMDFMKKCNTFTFRVLLPASVFKDIFYAEVTDLFDIKLNIFVFASLTLAALFGCISSNLLVKDTTKRSAIAQAAFRSNFVLLGTFIVDGIYGSAGTVYVASVVPIGIAMLNILAIITLTLLAPEGTEKKKINFIDIFIKILKNPMIIAIIIATILKTLGFSTLSIPVDKTVEYIARSATPIALLTIGGLFDLQTSLGNLKYSLSASFVRLVLVPTIGLTVAVLLGFRDEQLTVCLALLGTPLAVSATAMARSMGGDGQLSADIAMITTLLSLFTLFGFIFILRTLSLI